MNLRRALYLIQRTLGDYEAAQKGRLAKRVVRRELTRRAFQSLRRSK